MSTIIAFFSSDARELYKGDVFRALALPKDYVLQFRYERQYVQSNLWSKLETLRGKEGCIFFVQGNDTNISPDKRNLKIYSIRQVRIEDVYEDDISELVHFYLRLGEFADCSIHPNTLPENQPPYTFVSEMLVESGPNSNWINRVKDVESGFPNELLFYTFRVKQNNKTLVPTYSESERSAHFSLRDETEYQIEISFYDPTEGKLGLKADDSEMLTLYIPDDHRVGAERDTRIFTLDTHTLSRQRSIASTRFTQCEVETQMDMDIYSVELAWHIEKGPWKPWRFGLFTVFGAVGIAGLQLATKDLADINLTGRNLIVVFPFLIFILLGASFLFKFFNKK